MDKLKVTPEGRDGIFEVEKEDIADFILKYEFDDIHSFIPASGMMMGCDMSKDSIIERINKSEKIAILTGDNMSHNLGHALAIVTGSELLMLDIGEIKETDLAISE